MTDGAVSNHETALGPALGPAQEPAHASAQASAESQPTPQPGDLIAVYGTLRAGLRNHSLLDGRAEFVSDGYIRGRLHFVHVERPYPYPAYVPLDPILEPSRPVDEAERVEVEVYRVVDAAAWDELDELELFDPIDPENSEYVRELVTVYPRELSAWTYVFNREIGPTEPQIHGDWTRHPG